MQSSVTYFAPATVANLNCGFDCLGLALAGAGGDEVTCRLSEKNSLTISEIASDYTGIPKDPARNTATIAVQALLNLIGQPDRGIDLSIRKGLPGGSGLGSSAASAVAAVNACNELLQANLTDHQLVEVALVAEATVSGGRHIDNLAPAQLGGLVLGSCDETTHKMWRLPIPEQVHFIIATPSYSVSTADARACLPDSVTLKNAVKQSHSLAACIHAAHSGDAKLFISSLNDHLITPFRKQLMPGFESVKQAIKAEHDAAFGISGAGSTCFAATCSAEQASVVATLIKRTFAESKIEAAVKVCQPCLQGTHRISTD